MGNNSKGNNLEALKIRMVEMRAITRQLNRIFGLPESDPLNLFSLAPELRLSGVLEREHDSAFLAGLLHELTSVQMAIAAIIDYLEISSDAAQEIGYLLTQPMTRMKEVQLKFLTQEERERIVQIRDDSAEIATRMGTNLFLVIAAAYKRH